LRRSPSRAARHSINPARIPASRVGPNAQSLRPPQRCARQTPIFRKRDRAYASYRAAVAELLRGVAPEAIPLQKRAGERFVKTNNSSKLVVGKRPRVTKSGLHRAGLGLPIVARVTPGKTEDPNAPRSGYAIPVTVLAKESHGHVSLFAVDPQGVPKTDILGKRLPVAMNLEAALDVARETGPRPLDGLRYLLFSNWFQYPSQLVFLQPFNPAKTPVVLIHGLLSTPRMWKPVLKGLLADREIRDRYQFWFFFYPTGQPIPHFEQATPGGAHGSGLGPSFAESIHPCGTQYGRCPGTRPNFPNFACRSRTSGAGSRKAPLRECGEKRHPLRTTQGRRARDFQCHPAPGKLDGIGNSQRLGNPADQASAIGRFGAGRVRGKSHSRGRKAPPHKHPRPFAQVEVSPGSRSLSPDGPHPFDHW
jgi:hypothetical protein